jgi:uncharacterized protein YeaO (DUF488 family)
VRTRIRKPKIKRIYHASKSGDGCRVLVDRVWPRGLSKREAKIDLWLRDIAPSAELRQWFGHAPRRWDAFRRRYFEELDAMPETVALLCDKLRRGEVTLLYGARDQQHNNAVALGEYLRAAMEKK